MGWVDFDFGDDETVDGVVEDGEGGVVGVDVGEGRGDMFGIEDGREVLVDDALEFGESVGDGSDEGLDMQSAVMKERKS